MRLPRLLSVPVWGMPEAPLVPHSARPGESVRRIMLVEILPNALDPLIVDACLRPGYVTITIGVLVVCPI